MAFGSDLYNLFFGQQGGFQEGPSNYNPQQQQAIQSLLQQGMQGLGTDAIEGRARRGFQQSTIPLLSERFANIGQRGLSGIGSSGYQNALQGAGTELETNLAALRQENATNLLNAGLTPTGNNFFAQGQEGVGGDLIKLLADAGLTYTTGGLNKAGGILALFKNLFSGNNQGSTDIQAEAPNPLQKRFAQQSGHSLLQGQQGRNLGIPQGPFPTKSSVFNQFQKGGTGNILSLLNQSLFSGLGKNAPGAFLSSQLNRSYPGFEL